MTEIKNSKVVNPLSGRTVLKSGPAYKKYLDQLQDIPDEKHLKLRHFQVSSKYEEKHLQKLVYAECAYYDITSASDVSVSGDCWALVEPDGKIASFLLEEKNWIYNVFTTHTSRGKGYMTRLFHLFLANFKKNHPKTKQIHLGVWAANENAIRLYQSFGFVLGKRSQELNSKTGSPEDHYDMSLSLY